jgi:hypothetical protein
MRLLIILAASIGHRLVSDIIELFLWKHWGGESGQL